MPALSFQNPKAPLLSVVVLTGLGFYDDYAKIIQQSSGGTRSFVKLSVQSALALFIGLYLWRVPSTSKLITDIMVPFYKYPVLTGAAVLGLILTMLVIVGFSNAHRRVPDEIALCLVRRQDSESLRRVGQIIVAGGKRRHRGCIDLARGECREHVLFKTKGRRSHVLLVQQHGCDGTDLHANFGVVIQASESGDGTTARYGQSHAAAIIGFGDSQTGIGLHLGIGDRVENDIAIRPEGLRGDNYPLSHKSDTEFLRKRFAEFDLKTRWVPCLVGIGQGVGVSTEMERAGGSDHVQRSRRGRFNLPEEECGGCAEDAQRDAHPWPSGLSS